VTFNLDKEALAIRFTTSRSVQPGEELCIFYSHNLWFDDQNLNAGPLAAEQQRTRSKGGAQSCHPYAEDPLVHLLHMKPDDDMEDVLDEESLPFEQLKYLESEEEADVSATSVFLYSNRLACAHQALRI
jgi:tRNA-specific adenosine deaminase 3